MRSVVQIYLGPPLFVQGAVAQSVERLLCKQDASGSIPLGSTIGVIMEFCSDFLEQEFFEN